MLATRSAGGGPLRHGVAGDGRVRAAEHSDPGVVLDLGHSSTQDVDERDWLPPAPGWRLAGEDDQALSVPPHASGEMVDPEQILKLVRFGSAAFHAV